MRLQRLITLEIRSDVYNSALLYEIARKGLFKRVRDALVLFVSSLGDTRKISFPLH